MDSYQLCGGELPDHQPFDKLRTGGVTTYFVGNYYIIPVGGEVTGGVVTKYYYAGAQRVAVRTNDTLNFLLGDHLGSTSLTTDANGVVISEMRYTPWV